jgi:hypothetical protein
LKEVIEQILCVMRQFAAVYNQKVVVGMGAPKCTLANLQENLKKERILSQPKSSKQRIQNCPKWYPYLTKFLAFLAIMN